MILERLRTASSAALRPFLYVSTAAGLAAALWWLGPLVAFDGVRPFGSAETRAVAMLLAALLAVVVWRKGPYGLFAVALLGLAVWYGGPRVRLGEAAPWVSIGARMLTIGLVLLAYGGHLLWRLWQGLRGSEAWRARLLELVSPRGEPEQPEALACMTAKMRRALRQLRIRRDRLPAGRRLLAGDRHLYDTPWYLVIGGPGAGKTTAIRQCGLNYELDAAPIPEPLEPVRSRVSNCDWWLSASAVMLDTAGRYLVQEEHVGAADEWRALLGLLRRHRPRAPVDGVLLTLGVDELLLRDAAARDTHAQYIRRRLGELQQQFGFEVPVYVWVTKVDALRGYADYFRHLAANERTQPWGCMLDAFERGAPRDWVVPLRQHLADLAGRLAVGLRTRLEREPDAQRRRRMYALPSEFSGLMVPLVRMLEGAFVDAGQAGCGKACTLRGVFFVSAAQGEAELRASPTLFAGLGRHGPDGSALAAAQAAASIERAANPAGPSAPLAPEPSLDDGAGAPSPLPRPVATHAEKALSTPRTWHPVTAPPNRSRGHFLHDVVMRIVVPEGGRRRGGPGRSGLARALGHGLTLAIGAWIVTAMAGSYVANRRYLADVDARTVAIGGRTTTLLSDFRPAGVPGLLGAVDKLSTAANVNPADPPTTMGYGLSSVGAITSAAQTTRGELEERLLLPSIEARVESLLAQSVRDRDVGAAYASLRIYRLLHDPVRYQQAGGAATVRDWVVADWEATDSVAAYQGRAAMLAAVRSLFSGARTVQAATPIDPTLVRQAQALLASQELSQRLLDRVLAQLEPEAPPAFSLVGLLGPEAGSVFNRVGEEGREQGIPGMYTYDGYHRLFAPRVGQLVARALDEDDSLMDASLRATQTVPEPAAAAQPRPEPATDRGAAVERDVRRRYLSAYARRWEDYIGSIRTVGASPAEGAGLGFQLNVLRQLTAPESPLIRLARGLARETTLSTPLALPNGSGDSPGPASSILANTVAAAASAAGDAPAMARRHDLTDNADVEAAERTLVDDRFAPLRAVVAGPQPAANGAGGVPQATLATIVASLSAYYGRLVVADAAIAAGGVPGGEADPGAALAREADRLPAPFAAVFSALAADGSARVTRGTGQILRKEAQAQVDRLGGLLAQQVSDPCKREIAGRYPVAAVAQDVSMAAFTSFFGPGGAVEAFFNAQLAPYVDTSVRPWRYQTPSPLHGYADTGQADAGTAGAPVAPGPSNAGQGPTLRNEFLTLLARQGPRLDFFYRAHQIREMFFRQRDGRQLYWEADVRVALLDPSITELAIDIDGRSKRYAHGPDLAFLATWPGPRGGMSSELMALPRVSNATSSLRASGPWALLRLLDLGQVVPSATPGRVHVQFAFDQRQAVLDFNVGTLPNPLNSEALRGFQCPRLGA